MLVYEMAYILIESVDRHAFSDCFDAFRTNQTKWFSVCLWFYKMAKKQETHKKKNSVSKWLTEKTNVLITRWADNEVSLLFSCENNKKIVAIVIE